jgi:hypothetical protein
MDLMDGTGKHNKDLLLSKTWMKIDEKQQSILAPQKKVEEVKAQVSRGKHKNEGKFKRMGLEESFLKARTTENKIVQKKD